MADLLINHLKIKGEEHSSLKMLVNQWGFDELLIPKALQSVGILFPHYSRHDESHSKQILVNIERLLGDNIRLLTATDTWLLLESAYWHDIGMVVPQQDIVKAVEEPGFRQYLEKIRNSPHHELNSFAKNFNTEDVGKCFGGAASPMQAVDQFRQLMAEWFRQNHAGRAEHIIQNPWESAGISSPRTELIPARLFKLLGRVCQMHGMPFKALISPDGLPFKEAGLAQEDCHPRFVACLLRMGDLLDLDDNRFCPVMQRIAGENRSHISHAHEDKHAGMRHLRIDRERIEISAECKTIDGYLETFKWFDWLKQEIQDQMANWQDIAPNRELGLLPTLGPISVRLSGELQILKEGERPQFGVDGDKVIELLQGNNLYSSHFACIRELLQNAVDATLLNIWLKDKKRLLPEEWRNPFLKPTQTLLGESQITVSLIEELHSSNIPSGKSAWTLSITDPGTGISRDDLAHMLRIGGSQRNQRRQEKINTMPEWMKPSGAFGIGLQSVFLICDEITLTTKSIFTNESLMVALHSPTGNKEGLVLVKILESDISRPYGTTMKINFLLDTFTKSWSFGYDDNTSIASDFHASMDPVLSTSFPYEAAQLADKIQLFAINSLLPINAVLTTADGASKTIIEKDAQEETEEPNSWHFVDVNHDALAIRYFPTGNKNTPIDSSTWYRGQTFKQSGLHFPHVSVSVDLMSGKAGKWLTANRENLVSDAKESLNKIVLDALESQVRKDLDKPDHCQKLDAENKPAYSFFLEGMALFYGEPWVALARRVDKEWMKLPAANDDKPLNDYFQRDSWTLGETNIQNPLPIDGCDLLLPEGWKRYTLPLILNAWTKDADKTFQIQTPTTRTERSAMDSHSAVSVLSQNNQREQGIDTYQLLYLLSTGQQKLYTDSALAAALAAKIEDFSGNRRFILSCDERWSNLFLKDTTSLAARNLFTYSPSKTNLVLLPFLFKGAIRRRKAEVEATSLQIDSLCKWVQPHLISPLPIDDIRNAYKELIKYIDDEIMHPSVFNAKWTYARNSA